MYYVTTGIFAAPLETKFGTRAVIVASGFMVGGSVIAASFAMSVVQLTVILAFGFGNIAMNTYMTTQ